MSTLDTIKHQLLIKYPVFANIIVNINYQETTELEIAATDGKTIYYNPIYLELIPLSQQVFVFAHEICHIAFRHAERKKGKDARTWNIATDGIINQLLKEDNLSLLPNAIDIEDALDYDAEELYEKLLKEGYNSKNEGHASHALWQETAEEEETKVSETNFFHENTILKKERLTKYKEELKDSILERKEIEIENRFRESNQLLPWSVYLRENQKRNWDWSYQNATIEYGVVTPTIVEISYPLTEVLLDTSRSISREELQVFLSECRDLLRYSQLKIGCFDTKFYGFHKIRNVQELENMPLEGGGGTSFHVALSSFSRETINKIIFTDGEAEMPNIWMNVLWIVLGKKIHPHGGKVVYLTKEQLKEEQEKRFVKERK